MHRTILLQHRFHLEGDLLGAGRRILTKGILELDTGVLSPLDKQSRVLGGFLHDMIGVDWLSRYLV
jgi:hypothetical protein